MIRSLCYGLLLSITVASSGIQTARADSSAASREDARLITATRVLEELRSSRDQRIPDWLMQRAYGVAVIPDVIKGAVVVGGRYGNGVLTVRDSAGHFSNPIFIRLAGASAGWQIGATATDVVLIFASPSSVEHFARGKFTLGADASVAAGPMGREGDAAAGVRAEIYSYSRSRGLFAGVALDGTAVTFDTKANRAFYGDEDVSTHMITAGRVTTQSEVAKRFLNEVARSADSSASAPSAPAVAAPASNAAAPASSPAAPAPAPAANDVKTYPVEDAHPGSEPK